MKKTIEVLRWNEESFEDFLKENSIEYTLLIIGKTCPVFYVTVSEEELQKIKALDYIDKLENTLYACLQLRREG